MIYPTIHSNGTDRETLLDEYTAARRAVLDAIERFRAIEFNSRDYYVQGPDAFVIASEQHMDAEDHLLAASYYLFAIMEHLDS